MKPGTPLPWDCEAEEEDAFSYKGGHYTRAAGSYRVFMGEYEWMDVDGPQLSDEYATVEGVVAEQNAAYIVHAANLYPKLVEALKSCHALAAHYGPKGDEYLVREVLAARDLLAECGDQ